MKTSTDLCDPESDGELPRPFEIQSYKDLLQFPDIPVSTIRTPSGQRFFTDPLVDAIVVPTIRSAEHLRSAVQFAADTRCHLIAIYTGSPPAGLSDVLKTLSPDQVSVLTVRPGVRDRLLDLGASLPQTGVSPAALDISRKRNLGLLVGRLCGWTRIFFLDDDIRKLSVAKLSSAAALLDDFPVVGLQVKKFPDASVVGHARRLTGRRQEPFVSGGSLLVNPQILNGYFAPVYHEDWLCLIDHLRNGEVAIGGSVAQLPYLPFTTPERAEFEEFGDVLLSGLLWLVHARSQKGADPAGDSEYWREATNQRFWSEIIERRAALLQDLTERMSGMAPDTLPPSTLFAAAKSLAAARERLSELRPTSFVSFTEKWLASLTEWRDRLSVLSRVDLIDKGRAIEKAVAELGVAHVVGIHELSSQQARTRGMRWMSKVAPRWIHRSAGDSRLRFGLGSWFLGRSGRGSRN
jgi:hypothetical protein